MKIIFYAILIVNFLYSSLLKQDKWEKGESLLTFLEKSNIPLNTYYNLEPKDKELVAEINAGVKYFTLQNREIIEQILIPINDEMQIHLYRDIENRNKFVLDIIPIEYQIKSFMIKVDIRSSPYKDIIRITNNKLLAYEFVNAYKKSINFRRDLRKGDILVINYFQKERLGNQFTSPTITSSLVKTRRKKYFIFLYKDKYYNQNAEAIEGFSLRVPVRYKRISDKFTKKRWHPILKRYRAHLGIDYAAPRGTVVRAAANGKVSFVGRRGGYGKTITLTHENGYKTLYAHLQKYRKKLRRGRKISKGEIIGYVGSTGMSTGPHLHFGLYKGTRALNPANAILKVTKNRLYGIKKKKFNIFIKKIKNKLLEFAKDNSVRDIEKLNLINNRCLISENNQETL